MQKTKIGNLFRFTAPIAFLVGMFAGAWRVSIEGAEAVFDLVLFLSLGVGAMAVLFVAGYMIDGVWFETRSDEKIAEESAIWERGNPWLRSAGFAVPMALVLAYNRKPDVFMSAWDAVMQFFTG